MNKPISTLEIVSKIDACLKENGWNHSFFNKMVEKSENDNLFAEEFLTWIDNGSTITLRKITGYWNGDYDLQNYVDGIDSAMAMVG